MSKSVTFCEKKEVFMVIEIYNQLKLSENLTEICVAFQSGKQSEKKKMKTQTIILHINLLPRI